jgi:hypothetical protein
MYALSTAIPDHHDPVKLLLLPQLIQKDAVKAKQIASNAV